MKKTFQFALFILILISCKSTPENNKNTITEQNKKTITEEKKTTPEHETESIFELSDFNFSINQDDSIKKQENIYEAVYNFNFDFRTNKSIILSYRIYDVDNNVLSEKSNIKTGGLSIEKKDFSYKDSFSDSFAHSLLLYYLNIQINKKNYEYTGEIENSSIPSLDEYKVGPIITKYDNNKINTSLYIDLSIKNCANISWIHLIPPSKQYYWSLQPKLDSDKITANSIINDSKHINYIENGAYIIQINLGKLGVIQKEITIKDYLNNKNGPNYGLPLASEKNSDKNSIDLNVDFLDKVDYIELWLFPDNDKNSQKLGVAKFINPIITIPKKELYEIFFDDSDNRVKLKYNKKYFYKIYLYSKELNEIKYISISDPIPIIFQGFNLFNF